MNRFRWSGVQLLVKSSNPPIKFLSALALLLMICVRVDADIVISMDFYRCRHNDAD